MSTALLILCGVLFLYGLVLMAVVHRSFYQIRPLHPDPAAALLSAAPSPPPSSTPELSVVIPARNEAKTLEPALRSLLAQTGVDFEVILVNDHSTDATGEIAERLAEENPRLRVLHDPDLPAGWLGKPNAMQKGSELARAPVLLFSDADIHFRPGCLAAALRELRENRYDFFTLLPELRFETVMENALAPVFYLAVPAFAGARLEDPDSPQAVAAGAFLMIRRETYDAIGRHGRLRRSAVDDIGLARLVKRSGHRIGMRLGPQFLACRMYLSNRQAFWAVEKNILDGIEGKPWAAWLLLPGLLVYAWTGPVTAAVGLATRDLRLIAAGLALHVFLSLAFLVTRGFYVFRVPKLFLYPLGFFSVAACVTVATYHRFRGGVIWRGRVVKLD